MPWAPAQVHWWPLRKPSLWHFSACSATSSSNRHTLSWQCASHMQLEGLLEDSYRITLQLESRVIVNNQTRSSARAMHALKHWAIFPAPSLLFTWMLMTQTQHFANWASNLIHILLKSWFVIDAWSDDLSETWSNHYALKIHSAVCTLIRIY